MEQSQEQQNTAFSGICLLILTIIALITTSLSRSKNKCILNNHESEPYVLILPHICSLGLSQNIVDLNPNKIKKNQIAFVTSFFYFVEKPRQRHPMEYYRERFSSLLGNISRENDFYLYSNQIGVEILQPKSYDNLFINLTYEDPYKICGMSRYKKKYITISKKYCTKKIFISEDMGAIWNSKICLLEDVSMLSNNYKYIFWIDAGLIKKTNYSTFVFPSKKRVEKIFAGHSQFLFEVRGKSHFEPNGMNYIPMENLDPNFGNVIAAGFFGGRSESIKMARELFFKVHDIYLQKGMNVIREENIFNALFMYYPEYFMGLNMITSRCIEWDCAPIFISDKDICGFQNEVLLVKVVNNKFRIRGYDLGGWL